MPEWSRERRIRGSGASVGQPYCCLEHILGLFALMQRAMFTVFLFCSQLSLVRVWEPDVPLQEGRRKGQRDSKPTACARFRTLPHSMHCWCKGLILFFFLFCMLGILLMLSVSAKDTAQHGGLHELVQAQGPAPAPPDVQAAAGHAPEPDVQPDAQAAARHAPEPDAQAAARHAPEPDVQAPEPDVQAAARHTPEPDVQAAARHALLVDVPGTV